MNSIFGVPSLLALSLTLSTAAETPAETAPPKGKEAPAEAASAEALKQQLIASIQEDLKNLTTHATTPGTERYTANLRLFLDRLEQFPTIAPNGHDSLNLDSLSRQAGLSPKSIELSQKLNTQRNVELKQLLRKSIDDATKSGHDSIQRAFNLPSAEKDWEAILETIRTHREKIQGLTNYSDPFLRKLEPLSSLIDKIRNFQNALQSQDASAMATQLKYITRSMPNLTTFYSQEEANSSIEKLRKQAGLKSTEELEELAKRTINELLDDTHQDRLEEMVSQITRQSTILSNTSAETPREQSTRNKWTSLSQLASDFAKNVSRVKNGGSSQFSMERYIIDDYNTNSLIPIKELSQRIKAYKIRVTGDDGKTTTEPLIYQPREVMDAIQSLADLQHQLPSIKKLTRSRSYSQSDGIDWSQLFPLLESIAKTAGKLDEGNSFPLMTNVSEYSEYRRYSTSTFDASTNQKINALNMELNQKILRRFFPQLPASDTTPPEKTLSSMFETAKQERQYQTIVTLHQLSGFFTPGQPLLTQSELSAIQSYLAGLRQEEVLSQPRLATYHYQKCAAIPSSIVPVADLKKRLQSLKSSFPADYEKGTDDLFKASPSETYSQPSQLIVPAKTDTSPKPSTLPAGANPR